MYDIYYCSCESKLIVFHLSVLSKCVACRRSVCLSAMVGLFIFFIKMYNSLCYVVVKRPCNVKTFVYTYIMFKNYIELSIIYCLLTFKFPMYLLMYKIEKSQSFPLSTSIRGLGVASYYFFDAIDQMAYLISFVNFIFLLLQIPASALTGEVTMNEANEIYQSLVSSTTDTGNLFSKIKIENEISDYKILPSFIVESALNCNKKLKAIASFSYFNYVKCFFF